MEIEKEDLKKILPGFEKCSQSESSCRDDLGIWNDTVTWQAATAGT